MPELEITERRGKALSPTRQRPTDAPPWIDAIDNPYLHGLFAPVVEERDERVPTIEGTLPADLAGAYVRNGPNNRFAPTNRYHWFDGDGMLHAVWFEDGRARYRSRFIQTEGRTLEAERGEP